MKRLIFAVILASALGGCLKPPTPEQVQAADYGPAPKNYEAAVKAFMHSRLFDPYSAVYEFGQPWSWYYMNPPVKGGALGGFGWFVPVDINAKNRMGGYIGAQQYVFFFRGERLVGQCTAPPLTPAGTWYCQ
jgi:hypothetical protein